MTGSLLLSRIDISGVSDIVAARGRSIVHVASMAAESWHQGWSEPAVRGAVMVVVSTVEIVSIVSVSVSVDVARWQAVIEISGTHF